MAENFVIVEELIGLSISKKEKLLEILKFTREQKNLIKEDKMEALEKNLYAKEIKMKEIDVLDLDYLKQFEKLKEVEKIEAIGEIDLGRFSNLKTLKEVTLEISSLLGEINALDSENNKLFKEKFKDIKSQLKTVKDVKTAYKGYNIKASGSILIDERK